MTQTQVTFQTPSGEPPCLSEPVLYNVSCLEAWGHGLRIGASSDHAGISRGKGVFARPDGNTIPKGEFLFFYPGAVVNHPDFEDTYVCGWPGTQSQMFIQDYSFDLGNMDGVLMHLVPGHVNHSHDGSVWYTELKEHEMMADPFLFPLLVNEVSPGEIQNVGIVKCGSEAMGFACKDIQPAQELLTHYGPGYGSRSNYMVVADQPAAKSFEVFFPPAAPDWDPLTKQQFIPFMKAVASWSRRGKSVRQTSAALVELRDPMLASRMKNFFAV